jgi:hypothetical protein
LPTSSCTQVSSQSAREPFDKPRAGSGPPAHATWVGTRSPSTSLRAGSPLRRSSPGDDRRRSDDRVEGNGWAARLKAVPFPLLSSGAKAPAEAKGFYRSAEALRHPKAVVPAKERAAQNWHCPPRLQMALRHPKAVVPAKSGRHRIGTAHPVCKRRWATQKLKQCDRPKAVVRDDRANQLAFYTETLCAHGRFRSSLGQAGKFVFHLGGFIHDC